MHYSCCFGDSIAIIVSLKAEILKAVSAMKQAYQSNVPGMNSNQNQDDEFKNEIGEDIVDDSWKKQRYSSKELMKKLDAVSRSSYYCLEMISRNYTLCSIYKTAYEHAYCLEITYFYIIYKIVVILIGMLIFVQKLYILQYL